jgi:hypothetical protein
MIATVFTGILLVSMIIYVVTIRTALEVPGQLIKNYWMVQTLLSRLNILRIIG